MPVNDGTLNGWPFVNHAMELRGTSTPRGTGRNTIVYPRRKYTYLVEFQINPYALIQDQMQTNLLEHLKSGRLYASLKTIDHPKTNYKVQTFRSYNKYVKVATATEFPPASMSFHDDNSSIVMALWKEYDTFYRYAGDVGRGILATSNPQANQNNEFRAGNALTGETMRTSMESRPSVGMTLRPNTKRHFFDNIVIYDLGADGDSINIYSYVHPVITVFDHENLDYFDRAGMVSINITFEYENHYCVLGQNAANLDEVIRSYLGFAPVSPPIPGQGHTLMNLPSQNITYPVDEFSPNASPLKEDNQAVLSQNQSVATTGISDATEVTSLGPLATTQRGTRNSAFYLPETITETQDRLNTINDILSTADIQDLDQGTRGELEIYESILGDHLNKLNAQRENENKVRTTAPAVADAAKRTLETLG